jgi:hypothetical protein
MVSFLFKKSKSFILESRNSHKKINFSKGYAVGSLSRAMVEFMLNELNLTKFLAQLENGMYAVDEQLLSTLQADDEIQTPGGFTQKCNDDGYGTDCITRYSYSKRLRQNFCSPLPRNLDMLLLIQFGFRFSPIPFYPSLVHYYLVQPSTS